MTAANSPLHRRKALVVEDEVIISFLVEDLLSEFSCDVSLAANVPSALKLLDEGKPDFAVLDVNVGDEMVFPVAERLKKAGVPFIFTTGYGRAATAVADCRGNGRIGRCCRSLTTPAHSPRRWQPCSILPRAFRAAF